MPELLTISGFCPARFNHSNLSAANPNPEFGNPRVDKAGSSLGN